MHTISLSLVHYYLYAYRMYRSVGKLFMLNSKQEIDTLLDTQTEERQKAETQLKGKQVLHSKHSIIYYEV
jgi:hypothetical protein